MSAEYLLISGSLRSTSHSRAMAGELARIFETMGKSAEVMDLRSYPLPFCDAEGAYADSNVAKWSEAIASARVVIMAAPIYNYDVNAALKNLIEMTGGVWENKIVGFLCAAGGHSSYMSVMGFANSLMLDFRSIVIPRFVYATDPDFKNGKLTSEEVLGRLKQLAENAEMLRFENRN